jgi:hypothetical protein
MVSRDPQHLNERPTGSLAGLLVRKEWVIAWGRNAAAVVANPNTSGRFLISASDAELLVATPVPDAAGVVTNRTWRLDIVLDRG